MASKASELELDLISAWKESPFPSLKVSTYFPAYAELFGHLVGERCTFIETGVLDGGSLFMWRRWLGKDARIIGVDMNPDAEKWQDSGFEIFIGDQGDPAFWRTILPEIGHFDALLDDGGHQSFQQIVTALEAVRFVDDNCVIAIEDTFSNLMSDFSAHGKRTFLEYAKATTDLLLGRSFGMYENRFPSRLNSEAMTDFARLYRVQFYAGIVAFHIDKRCSQAAQVVRNRDPEGASDFRYKGKASASVNWPILNSASNRVTIRGGQRRTMLTKLKAVTKRLMRGPKNPKS